MYGVRTVVILQSELCLCSSALRFLVKKYYNLGFVDDKPMSDIMQLDLYLYRTRKMSLLFAIPTTSLFAILFGILLSMLSALVILNVMVFNVRKIFLETCLVIGRKTSSSAHNVVISSHTGFSEQLRKEIQYWPETAMMLLLFLTSYTLF